MKGLLVLDTETDGLSADINEIVEISWWSFVTGHRDTFVPPHTLTHADPEALAINQYWERGLDREPQDHDGSRLRRLHAELSGNLLVGSNPGFDVGFLKPLFVKNDLDLSPLAYPPLDVPTYAAGILGRQLGERVGLTQLCRILGVKPGTHSAESDTFATGLCLIRLQEIAQSRKAAA